ncbi:unnamed protein product [Urochloa humidicola]
MLPSPRRLLRGTVGFISASLLLPLIASGLIFISSTSASAGQIQQIPAAIFKSPAPMASPPPWAHPQRLLDLLYPLLGREFQILRERLSLDAALHLAGVHQLQSFSNQVEPRIELLSCLCSGFSTRRVHWNATIFSIAFATRTSPKTGVTTGAQRLGEDRRRALGRRPPATCQPGPARPTPAQEKVPQNRSAR